MNTTLPLCDWLYDTKQLEEMRMMLREFYQVLKDEGAYLKFVFITGVTKFSQMSIFSELNNLKQVSMFDEYSGLCGITQEELNTILRPCVEEYAEALGISVTVFLDYDINTVSDVLSLVMKLNEQSSLKISADKDKDGNYIPSSIHMTFEDSQINEAICSYLNCKQQIDLIAYEDNDKAVIEQQKEFYDDKINRLLLFNERIKKIR